MHKKMGKFGREKKSFCCDDKLQSFWNRPERRDKINDEGRQSQKVFLTFRTGLGFPFRISVMMPSG